MGLRRESAPLASALTIDTSTPMISTSAGAAPSAPGSTAPVTADALRAAAQAEADRAASMWAWDASGPYALQYAGGFTTRSSTDGTRAVFNPWRPGQSTNDIDCNWSRLVVNAVCNADNVKHWVLQIERFEWAQDRVRSKLLTKRGMPALTSASAPQWATWIRDTLRYVSMAYWALNVRDWYANVMPDPTDPTYSIGKILDRSWLAWDGPAVDAWRERMRVASRTVFGSSVKWPAVDSSYPLRSVPGSALGSVDSPAYPQNPLPFKSWGRAGDAGQALSQVLPVREADFNAPDLAGTKANDGRYLKVFRPQAGLIGSIPGHTTDYRDSFEWSPAGDRLAAFTRWLAATAELPWATRPLWVGAATAIPGGRYNPTTGVRDGFTSVGLSAAGQGLIDFVEAVATDLVTGTYFGVLLESLGRWSDSVAQMPAYVQGGVSGLRSAVENALATNRAIAQGRIAQASAGTSALSTVSGSSSGGAAIIQIVQTIYQGISEGIGSGQIAVATGASAIPSCPPPPFARVMLSGGCDVGALIDQIRASATPTAITTVRPGSGTPPSSVNTSLRPSSGGALVVGGAGALILALLALAK